MSEFLDYVSFQRKICENQLNSYSKILSESHPKYKLLKEEYEFYLLMEDITKSLENQGVTANQIDDATKILQNILNQFKSSLSTLNEVGAVGKFFRGLTKGHDINVLEKEKSVQNFTQVYQSFKPLLQASNIIDGMLDKAEQQGATFNVQSLKPLKLSGSMGAELKNLILTAASSPEGIQKLKSSLQTVQNYGQASTNPILSNFISDDLIKNSIDVGIKSSFGSAQLRSQGLNKPTGWMKDLEGELGGGKDQTMTSSQPNQSQQSIKQSEEPNFNDGGLFKGIQHAPEEDVDLSDLEKQTGVSKEKQKKGKRTTFRASAESAGIDTQTTNWMVKNGFAKWAEANPQQLTKLASLISGGSSLTEAKKKLIYNFVKECEKEKQLVTEVVNKWNKLAGLKG